MCHKKLLVLELFDFFAINLSIYIYIYIYIYIKRERERERERVENMQSSIRKFVFEKRL